MKKQQWIPVFLTLGLAIGHAQQSAPPATKTPAKAGTANAKAPAKPAAKTAAKPAATASGAAATPQKPAPGSTTIPKDAVQVEPGIWRATDANGKVWLYRRTPFAIAKYEPETEADRASAGLDLMAFEEGDSVRFERKTPFGTSRWTKKKAELTDDELAAWKRAAPAGSRHAASADAKAATKE